jgi:2'-5' RNA ligase
MPQELRTFLAIDLPDPIKEKIIGHLQTFRDLTKSSVKWVEKENLHITLKFLGKFGQSHIDHLNTSLTDRLKTISIFKMHIDRMGAFPNLHLPKVIWLGFDNPDNLSQIYKHIEDSVVKLGYAADNRSFSPHLTLGRVRRDLPGGEIKSVGQILASAELNFQAEFTAERITFFQSELSREGPIYAKLFEVNLTPNPSLC